jgi:LAO/AO transport system kinase
VLVHKADSDLATAALRVREQCAAALGVLRGSAAPPVLTGSSLTGAGLDELWQALQRMFTERQQGGALRERRRQQAVDWLDESLREQALARFLALPAVRTQLDGLRAAVREERMLPHAAVRRLLAAAEGRP